MGSSSPPAPLPADPFPKCRDTCPPASCLLLSQLTPEAADGSARFRLSIDTFCFRHGTAIDFIALVIGGRCFTWVAFQ
jgi:hypothetical protein